MDWNCGPIGWCIPKYPTARFEITGNDSVLISGVRTRVNELETSADEHGLW